MTVNVELVTNRTLQIEDANVADIAATIFGGHGPARGEGVPLLETSRGAVYVNPDHVVAVWDPGEHMPMASWGQ